MKISVSASVVLTIALIVFLWRSVYAQTTVPEVPGYRTVVNLQSSLSGDGNLHLYWDVVPTATGYKIFHTSEPAPFNSGAWAPVARVSTPFFNTTAADAKGFYCVTWDTIPASPAGFTLVEGGTFHNGSSNVNVSTFYISTTEITQSDYLGVTGQSPSYHVHGYGIGPNYPVWNVSWCDAIVYCNQRSLQEGLTPCYSFAGYGTNPTNWPADWPTQVQQLSQTVACNWPASGYRLLTEMEWQFAARGGIYSHGYTYSGSNNIYDVAIFWGNWGYAWYSPRFVAGEYPNEIGTYDMSGNISEWVWDVYGDYPSTPQTDPHGPSELSYSRVCRGGGWNSGDPISCRVSYRSSAGVTATSGAIGFRVCRIAP